MGMRTFVLTLLVSVLHFVVVGQIFSFGFLVHPFEKTFTISNSTNSTDLTLSYVSSIGTVQLGLFMGLQFITAVAFNYRYNIQTSPLPEVFLLFGIIFWFVGLFATTYTVTGAQLFGVYSSFTGLGSSLIYWTSLAMVSEFDGEMPLVTVLVSGGIGQIVYFVLIAPHYSLDVVNTLLGIDESWRISLRFLSIVGGCIMFFSLICIALIRWDFCLRDRIQNNNFKQASLTITQTEKEPYRMFGRPNSYLTTAFVFLVITVLFSGFAMYAPYVHLVEYLLTLDVPLTQQESSIVLLVIGIFGILGRLSGELIYNLLSICVNDLYVYWPVMLVFAQLHNAVVIATWQLVYEYIGAIVFGAFFGFGFGLSLSCVIVITSKFSKRVFNGGKNMYDYTNTYAVHLIPISISMAISAVGAGTVFGLFFESCGYVCAINAAMGFQIVAFLSSCVVLALIWKTKKD